jgi:putative membrane protein
MRLLLRWAIAAGTLFGTIWLLTFFDQAKPTAQGWMPWFGATVIMALVNALIRPIAALLTAPLNCLTFGLVGVLVNALMFWLVPVIARQLGMPIFDITPVGALIGSLVVPAVDGLVQNLLLKEDEERK